MKIFLIMCFVAAVKCTQPSLTRSQRAWSECRGGSQCVPLSHCGRFCDLIKYTIINLIFPFVNTFLVRNGGLRNRGAVQMLRDQTCWVDSNNIPSVCCPEEETLVAERCLSCGRQQNTKDKVYAPLCINCDDARPGDYPWMARLFFRGVCF